MCSKSKGLEVWPGRGCTMSRKSFYWNWAQTTAFGPGRWGMQAGFWTGMQSHMDGSPQHRLLFFFPSVAADLALRLGPDSERSGRKVCKKYETLWLHKRGKPWKKQQTQQKETRQQRRDANLPARFAFRQQRKQRNNTKRRRSHTKKHPTNPGIASDTIGLSPPCLRNTMAQTNQKGVRS